MTRSVRSLVLAVLLPSLCACSTSSSARRSPNAVTLRFAWPEPFSARVSYSFTMNSPLGNTEVHRRYWLLEEPAKDKGVRRLVPRDVEVFPPQYAAMVDPVPTVRFDKEGAFLGVELPEQLPGQQLLEALPVDPEKKAEIIKNLQAKQEESDRDDWERLVEHWRGVTLVPGEPVRRESKMVVGTGMMEKKEVPAEERYTLEVDVPCSQDARERRCVRLTVQVQPLGQPESGEGPMARWGFELVTDPDTLVPYSTRLTRLDRVDWGEDSGARPLEEFLQVEEYVYTYGVQRVPPGSNPL
ncbi:hypothetical protein [Archangium sp.]|uniref:hypothetical protein n=1 Tax=Archangium sp. TaxID=1872627 RepID=UPI00389B1987